MLYLIKDFADSLLKLISEDPVRPHIPDVERVGTNKDIFVSRDEDKVNAITCVSYQQTVPTNEAGLFEKCDEPTVAIFYTIWSYQPGAGRQLILDSVKYIQDTNKSITRFVTLSPKTEMAKKFHLKNGAVVFRENEESVNYEYKEV
jgi:hypothetical protein